jgi:hypothetical protein
MSHGVVNHEELKTWKKKEKKKGKINKETGERELD